MPDPHRYMGLFDVFALTSDTEQFQINLVEAMAAGLPAVCTDVGDIRSMLPGECTAFVHAREGEDALASAMRTLLTDAEVRKAVGTVNRARVKREYSLARIIETYHGIYASASKSRETHFA